MLAIEAYFKTDNDHWNEYTFDMYCMNIQQGVFENPELPLKLFTQSIRSIEEQYETPIIAVSVIVEDMNNNSLTEEQQQFILEWINKFILGTDFEEANATKILKILQAKVEVLRKLKPE